MIYGITRICVYLNGITGQNRSGIGLFHVDIYRWILNIYFMRQNILARSTTHYVKHIVVLFAGVQMRMKPLVTKCNLKVASLIFYLWLYISCNWRRVYTWYYSTDQKRNEISIYHGMKWINIQESDTNLKLTNSFSKLISEFTMFLRW